VATPTTKDALWTPEVLGRRHNYVRLHDGETMKVHADNECRNANCVVHNPSPHALNRAPLLWLPATSMMYRICPHIVAHPDPDALTYWVDSFAATWLEKCRQRGAPAVEVVQAWLRRWAKTFLQHHCDGCCGGESAYHTTIAHLSTLDIL
jgi:hypothetical protein